MGRARQARFRTDTHHLAALSAAPVCCEAAHAWGPLHLVGPWHRSAHLYTRNRRGKIFFELLRAELGMWRARYQAAGDRHQRPILNRATMTSYATRDAPTHAIVLGAGGAQHSSCDKS